VNSDKGTRAMKDVLEGGRYNLRGSVRTVLSQRRLIYGVCLNALFSVWRQGALPTTFSC